MLPVPSSVGRVVYSNLELAQMQTLHPNMQPGLWATTEPDRRNGLLSGTGLLDVPMWSLMPREAMSVTVIHATAPRCDEARDPGGYMLSLLLTEALVMSSCFTALGGGHVDVSGLWFHPGPFGCLWSVPPPEAMLMPKGQGAGQGPC